MPKMAEQLTRWGFMLQLVFLWLAPFIVIAFTMSGSQLDSPVQAGQGIQFDEPPKQLSDFDNTNVQIGVPQRLVIPRLDIDVSVLPGEFNAKNETWTISDGAAYFASITTPANDSEGTTLIYGHNIWQVFGALEYADKQTTVLIYTDTDLLFEYSFTIAQEVKPNDVSVLYASGEPQLVLQTCSGRWNEKRTLYYFELLAVRSV